MAKDIKYHLIVRGVPAAVHSALERAATANNRTKAGQVRHLLEQWAKEQESNHAKPA